MNRCLICGYQLNLFCKVRDQEIYKCSNCGFGVTEGAVIQKGEYHRDKTYIGEEALFKNIFAKRVRIILKFKKVGSALEIGCSTGLMLSLLKEKGWQVCGVEISRQAAQKAEKRGVKIIPEDFLKAVINEKFDLVILNHTLEHLENPDQVIEKATKLLNKDGLLYIDLPNFGSLSAKILRGSWPALLPKEHRWHFSEKTLSILLEKFDFKIIFTEKASGIWDYQRSFYGIFLSLISFKKRFFKELLTAKGSWVVTKLKIGSDLMVIAKKI